MSEIAILLFVVKNEMNKIAQAGIPVDAIRPGYRVIELKRHNGGFAPFCNLFCHFAVQIEEKK